MPTWQRLARCAIHAVLVSGAGVAIGFRAARVRAHKPFAPGELEKVAAGIARQGDKYLHKSFQPERNSA